MLEEGSALMPRDRFGASALGQPCQ